MGGGGLDDFNGNAALAPAPTTALPGTPEKVAVLEERAAAWPYGTRWTRPSAGLAAGWRWGERILAACERLTCALPLAA